MLSAPPPGVIATSGNPPRVRGALGGGGDGAKLVFFGLLMLVTSWIFWNYYDVRIFAEWGDISSKHGVLGIYRYSPKSGYMPLALLTYVGMYRVARGAVSHLSGSLGSLVNMDMFYVLILKLPVILASLGIGYVLYRREGWRVARWWFYGIPVWTVVYMYQFEPLMVLPTLIGAYMIVDRRYGWAGLLMGVGASVKYMPAVLIPVIFKVSKRWRDRLLFLLGFTLPVALTSIPFMLFDAESFLSKTIGFHAERLPQMLSIFNIPAVLWGYNSILTKTLSVLWIPLLVSSYLVVLTKFGVREGDKRSIFSLIAALIILFVVFNKVSNPQYMFWFYPFLVYLMGANVLKKGKKTMIIAASLIAVLYPVILVLPAAILGLPVFVEEDAAYYDARLLVVNSFNGVTRKIVAEALQWAKIYGGSEIYYLYRWHPLAAVVLIAAYNLSLGYVLLSLVAPRWVEGLERRLYGVSVSRLSKPRA